MKVSLWRVLVPTIFPALNAFWSGGKSHTTKSALKIFDDMFHASNFKNIGARSQNRVSIRIGTFMYQIHLPILNAHGEYA